MCGRYQFTEPQNADLRRILQDVRRRCGDRAQDFRFGDVMPTAAAPVLIANGGKVVADLQTWGIPGWKGGLMINARAETVCEKPMFRRSMAAQRCVIPATSFYGGCRASRHWAWWSESQTDWPHPHCHTGPPGRAARQAGRIGTCGGRHPTRKTRWPG